MPAQHPLPDVRALVFDVFGTVVDWHGSVLAEGAALSARLGLPADWAGLVAAWRAGYFETMQQVDRGERPRATVDELHRAVLDDLLPRFGLGSLGEAERVQLNRVWHRLAPWPDSLPGLQRLKLRYPIATLSNGNIALLVAMARHSGLPWDAVFSAELFGAFKPDARVYQGAARLLGLAPAQVMLVACHPFDLVGAQQAGLRTAYIPRPDEYGPGGWMEPVGEAVFDLACPSLTALAEALQCG